MMDCQGSARTEVTPSEQAASVADDQRSVFSRATGANRATAWNVLKIPSATSGAPERRLVLPNHEGSARSETDEQAHRLIASAPPSLDVCPCWRVYLKSWHDGKRLRRAGVWYHAVREGKDGQRRRSDDWICSPLTVEAISVDARGEAFGRLLRFPDVLGRSREWIMPMPLLRGEGLELRGALLARGLLFEPRQRQRLVQYLMHQVPKRQILQVPTLGWHEGRFVLPDTVIGGGEIRFESEATQPLDYAQSGTLAQWREQVAAAAVGNLVLVLAISAAFAGPLLALMQADHAGLHLYGDSSGGKSTALRAAVSVWGSPAMLRSWQATANGMEAAAAESNDTLLALDELGQADGRDVGAVIYQLANGRGKGRANVQGGTRRRAHWRTVILSSGERTVNAHMQADGGRYQAGQAVRLINLPAGERAYGAFDQIHGAADGAAFADALSAATQRLHGTAGRAFLHGLVGQQPDQTLSKAVLHLMEGMSVTHGQAARVAKQLALIGTAGEWATAAGITGWPAGIAADAVLDAYQLWQSEQGSRQAEDRQILESVRSFIERHGESRFAPRHATSAHPIRERAGYTEEDPATGQVTYLFLASGLREALSGQDLKRGLIALARAGWLVKGSGDKHRLQRKIQGKNTNVYAVSLPDDELDDADARQA